MAKRVSIDTYCSQFVYILYEDMEPKKKCSPIEKHFGLQVVLRFSVQKAVHDHMTCVAQGLIGKNQPSNVDKELSGATLRDLWDNSSNMVTKPLAPIGGGVSVHRANQGKAPSETGDWIDWRCLLCMKIRL